MAWFRGASENATIDTESKSMIVYGQNGAGKSSFVDAIEFILDGGRIGHLAHEYSGKHQEKGIINTHTPKGQKTELRIKFNDDSEMKTEIKPDGTFTSAGGEVPAMGTWDYRRTVLRQDEVAAFIRGTKGDKCSALLPLLGLHHLEVAAENLRQLIKSVEQQSNLQGNIFTLKAVETKREEIFGRASVEQVLKNVEDLHKIYTPYKASNRI